MKEEDKILLEGLQSRQEFAYVYLFKAYYRQLHAFAAHYLANVEAAHDIVQGLFTEFYEKGEKLSVTTSLKSYLFSSVKNRCLNYLRELKIRDSHAQNIIEAHIFSHSVETFKEGALIEELKDVIEEMPPGMQEVFRLRIVEGYKFKEIGETLQISENSAKVQMSQAVKMIRERLPALRERILSILFHWAKLPA